LTFDRPFGPIGTDGFFDGPGAAIGAPGLVAAPAFAPFAQDITAGR
jgi:hypothetical protein